MPPKKKSKKKAAKEEPVEEKTEWDDLPPEQIQEAIALLKAGVDRAQLDRNQVQLDRVRCACRLCMPGLTARVPPMCVRVGGCPGGACAGHDPDIL